MKQLVLFQMIFSFCVSLQAQDSIQKKRILTPTIEISGGTGIALYNKDDKTAYKVQQDLLYATDFLVGLDFVEPHGNLSVQTGIILDNHDFSFTYNYEGTESCHVLFLSVPLSLGYHHLLKENILFSVSGSLLFRNFVQYEYSCSSFCTPRFNLKNKENGLTYGVSIAIGIHYYFAPHFSLHPQLYFAYNWGTNAIDSPFKDLLHISTSPIIGIKIGIKYNILKTR